MTEIESVRMTVTHGEEMNDCLDFGEELIGTQIGMCWKNKRQCILLHKMWVIQIKRPPSYYIPVGIWDGDKKETVLAVGSKLELSVMGFK